MRSEPKYATWSIVDDDYAQAADLWAPCDPGKSAQARAERQRARDLYTQLIHPTQPTQPPGGMSQKCKDAEAYFEKFSSGMGRQWIDTQLAQMGCKK